MEINPYLIGSLVPLALNLEFSRYLRAVIQVGTGKIRVALAEGFEAIFTFRPSYEPLNFNNSHDIN